MGRAKTAVYLSAPHASEKRKEKMAFAKISNENFNFNWKNCFKWHKATA